MSAETIACARLDCPERYPSPTCQAPASLESAHHALRRHLAYGATAAALTVCLAVSLASATLAASAAASPSRPQGLTVTGGPSTAVSGMMPGDTRVVRLVELRATGPMRYQMHVTCSGSQALADTLQVVFSASDGSVLYRGPLAGARVGGSTFPAADDPRLADGRTELISISATLPLATPPELAGASLEFTIQVLSYPDAR
jgi:hypothetical protein